MSEKVKPRVARGMRDMLPEQMVRRQYVFDVIRGVFEEFGFEPIQTPAIELEETLKGKYGPEAERLIYSTTYGSGEEKLSLRYDLSVPLCRVIAMHPGIPKPLKRYQIAPVWRADRPQKGRFREFYQCDADTVGSSSMLGDAETVAVICTILQRLGFRRFTVQINNRKILIGIGQFAGVADSLLQGLYQSIDKLPKIGRDGVKRELLAVGLPDPVFDGLRRICRLYLQGKVPMSDVGTRLRSEVVAGLPGEDRPFPEEVAAAVEPSLTAILEGATPGEVEPEHVQEVAGDLAAGVTGVLREIYAGKAEMIPEEVVERLLSLLEVGDDNQTLLGTLRERLSPFPKALEGIDELEEMLRYLRLLGISEGICKINVSMVRGLDYYTGPIYETVVEEAGLGSITGGGRFDNLIGMFTDRSLPATGTSIGIERLMIVMEEQDMFPATLGRTATQVLVTVFDDSLRDESIRVAAELRQAGLRVQIYFDPDALRDQIGYARTKDIPIVVILGPDEASKSVLTVRNMRRKEQETVPRDQAPATIKEWVANRIDGAAEG